jgi:hypothetical protein
MSQDVFARILNVSTKTVQKLGAGGSKAVAGCHEVDPGVSSEPVRPARGRRYVWSNRQGEASTAEVGRKAEPDLIPSLWWRQEDH